MAKTKEQIETEVNAEIDALKTSNGGDGLFGQRFNAKTKIEERYELSDDDYEQKKTDIADSRWNEQQFGYMEARQSSYPSIGDQLDMLWHAIDGNKLDKTSDFYKDLKKVKDDNPKPS